MYKGCDGLPVNAEASPRTTVTLRSVVTRPSVPFRIGEQSQEPMVAL
jgi:hypothetical protein